MFALQRTIPGLPDTGAIAALTHTFIPGQTPEQVSADIGKAYQIQRWFRGKKGSTSTFTAVAPGANRLVQVYLRSDQGGSLLTLVTIRRIFALPALIEADWIESQLNPQKTKSASLRLLDWLLPEAQAGTGLTIPPQFAGALGTTNLPSINLSPNVTLGPGVQNSLNQVSGQLGQFQTVGNNGVNAINGLSNSIQTGTASLSGSIDRSSQSVDRATNAVNNVFSTKNLLKYTFIAGAGGSAGVAAFQAGLNGSIFVITRAWHMMLGTLPPDIKEKILDRSSKAIENLENAARQQAELESDLDRHLLMLSMVAPNRNVEELLVEDLLAASNHMKRSSDKRISQQMDAFKRANEGSQEELDCQKAMDVEEKLQNDLGIMIGILGKYRGKRGADICRQIDSDIRSWHSAQATMRQSRDVLMNDMLVVMGLTAKKYNDARKKLGSDRANKNACKDEFETWLGESQSRLAQAQCGNSPTSGNCQALKHAEAAMKEAISICLSTSETRMHLDDTVSFAKDAEFARTQMKDLQSLYKSLVDSDGKDGTFTRAEAAMKAKLAEARGFCPSGTLSGDLLGSTDIPVSQSPASAPQASAAAPAQSPASTAATSGTGTPVRTADGAVIGSGEASYTAQSPVQTGENALAKPAHDTWNFTKSLFTGPGAVPSQVQLYDRAGG